MKARAEKKKPAEASFMRLLADAERGRDHSSN
jgi:hypothetical protein